jgi:amylosucrase/maltose alpha-D-glucosyltransferase/alpha-amylase
MRKRISIPEGCAWVNYVRCHDDIGWAFSDDDGREVEIDPKGHRKFLSQFYTGRFDGSFARGLPFQENPLTGDVRVSGTNASLCGLEGAIEAGDRNLIDLAIRRILLLHAVVCTLSGIPLIYLGDEIGLLNDYDHTKEPEKDGDTRWVHRPRFDRGRASESRDPESIPGRIYNGILRLI